MRAFLAVCLALLASPLPAQRPAARPAPLEAEVVRDGDRWTAELRFNRRARAWVFTRSALTEHGRRPWRPLSWTIETPGVRLERHGAYDVLVAADGRAAPRRARIRFTPFRERVASDYDPALVFTDGAVALYTGQFDAFPYDDVAGIERLPADTNALTVPYSATRVTFRDADGRVLAGGRRRSSATFESAADGSYVLFGAAEPIVTDAITLVLDPQLPQWLRTALARSTPDILARYAAALGPAPGPKPTIMVAWTGPTPGVTSQGGGTLSGLVVMRLEGAGLLDGDQRARHSNLWFIAHESAHFWLGQAVHYRTAFESWITEGGADLLAVRAVSAVDPAYDARAELQRGVDDCVSLSAGRGVARALERNEQRAYYACGAVFALVAEAASRRPFIHFVRTLVDANRADRELTRQEWLAELDRVSRDPSLGRDIGVMLDSGAADPKAMIASLFTRAGVRFTRGDDGLPRLQ